MSNTKLHPSIVVYTRNRFDDYSPRYYVGNRQVSAEDVAEVSNELWEVTLSQPERPHRTPRGEDMLWT